MKRSKYPFRDFSAKHTPSATLSGPGPLGEFYPPTQNPRSAPEYLHEKNTHYIIHFIFNKKKVKKKVHRLPNYS